jgi:hypothetical protein
VIPCEAIIGARVLNHIGHTAGEPDRELVDGSCSVAAGRRRPDHWRSDQGRRWGAVRQDDRKEEAILKELALRPIPTEPTRCGASGLEARAESSERLPHSEHCFRGVSETVIAASDWAGSRPSERILFQAVQRNKRQQELRRARAAGPSWRLGSPL